MNKNGVYSTWIFPKILVLFLGIPVLVSSVSLKTHFTVHKANYETVNYGSLLEITEMVFDSIVKALRSFMVKKPVELITEHFLYIWLWKFIS